MKLILMTRPEFFVEEHRILTALFDEGLDMLHLRKPNTEPVLSERLLSLIPENYRKQIVVHDHFYLKNEYGLKGVHLNLRNPALPNNYKGHISCLCHNAEELQSRSPYCDYTFLSPVFESLGSDSFSQMLPFAKLKEWCDQRIINGKVMAAGSIGAENIEMVRQLGFGGCVVLGDIWNRFQPLTDSSFSPLLTHFRKLRKLTL